MRQQNVFSSIVLGNRGVIWRRTFPAACGGEQSPPSLCSYVARGSGRDEKLILLFSEAGRIRDGAGPSRVRGSCLAALRGGGRSAELAGQRSAELFLSKWMQGLNRLFPG